eukprot:gb/GECG01015361.1/.p1 GENE.gb/GECG01015361.1/~~gb/GECG01015361.1/.p1  ORF type:complete len:482 (+),score=68.11 gb/GECG01015361.1/:1-1446(+)
MKRALVTSDLIGLAVVASFFVAVQAAEYRQCVAPKTGSTSVHDKKLFSYDVKSSVSSYAMDEASKRIQIVAQVENPDENSIKLHFWGGDSCNNAPDGRGYTKESSESDIHANIVYYLVRHNDNLHSYDYVCFAIICENFVADCENLDYKIVAYIDSSVDCTEFDDPCKTCDSPKQFWGIDVPSYKTSSAVDCHGDITISGLESECSGIACADPNTLWDLTDGKCGTRPEDDGPSGGDGTQDDGSDTQDDPSDGSGTEDNPNDDTGTDDEETFFELWRGTTNSGKCISFDFRDFSMFGSTTVCGLGEEETSCEQVSTPFKGSYTYNFNTWYQVEADRTGGGVSCIFLNTQTIAAQIEAGSCPEEYKEPSTTFWVQSGQSHCEESSSGDDTSGDNDNEGDSTGGNGDNNEVVRSKWRVNQGESCVSVDLRQLDKEGRGPLTVCKEGDPILPGFPDGCKEVTGTYVLHNIYVYVAILQFCDLIC